MNFFMKTNFFCNYYKNVVLLQKKNMDLSVKVYFKKEGEQAYDCNFALNNATKEDFNGVFDIIIEKFFTLKNRFKDEKESND